MPVNTVKQSGQVTPGHLAAWVTDGTLADAGLQFNNTYGLFVATLQNVNFNISSGDSPIAINLPLGYTRYIIDQIVISGASASLMGATCGVFTQIGGAGVTIVGATALIINTNASDAITNMQSLPIANQDTLSLIDPRIYFRTLSPVGANATASVSVFYRPLP